MSRLAPVIALAVAATITLPGVATALDQTHAALTGVLGRFVTDARVDYAGLKADPAALNRYLRQLAGVREDELAGWSKEQQLAFFINLYNAATLDLIVDHHPVESIKDIGGFFSGPWKQAVVRLFGEKVTLDHVEHGILRKRYREPRVHFALVCAAKGCPPLRPEAYTAERLDAQLEDQGRTFLGDATRNRVDVGARTVHLSPIFDWFAGDFEKAAGSVLAFVAPYFPEGTPRDLSGYAIENTTYDWSLNEARR